MPCRQGNIWIGNPQAMLSLSIDHQSRSSKTKYKSSYDIYRLLFDHTSMKAALSFTVNPTLLTRPSRASASPTLSKILFSSGLTSGG
jgi:hypothetical protein